MIRATAILLFAGLAQPSLALRLSPVARQSACANAAQAGKTALVAAFCSAQLLGAAPAALAAPTLPEAIVETSEAAYPILKALPKDTFPPFSAKLADLFLGIKPDKLAKSLDLGIDVFLSVPDEKVTAFNGVVKEAFDGLKTDSCDLVPLPPKATVDKFTSSEALAAVDAAKLKAFDDKWGPTLKALPKTDAAICLPAAEKLDKLALAQAQVGKSFGKEEAKKFGTYFGGIAQASITPGKIFPLIGEGQKQTMGASLPERQRFKAAGSAIETISKTCAALPNKPVCELP